MSHRRADQIDVAVFAVMLAGLVALILSGATGMDYAWQWARLRPFLWREVDGTSVAGPLLTGFAVTLQVSGLAAAVTLPVGLMVALLQLSSSVVGRVLSILYVGLVRNTPLLLQMLIVYFVIGRLLGIPRLWCGVLTLASYEGAFAAEIIRGGILSVHRGQWEASRSLGLSAGATYRKVILPQALPLMLPPMTGVLVNLIKHSSIVSVIAIFDLTTEARSIAADTFMSFEVWLAAAALYLSVTVTLSLLAGAAERHLAGRAR